MGVVKHPFASPIADSGDANEVSSGEWNADHTVTLTAADVSAIALAIVDAAGDLIKGTGADTVARVARGSDDQFLRATATDIAWESIPFSVGALLEGAPPAAGIRMVWVAPFPCTVTAIRSHFDAGTNVVVNARKNQASNFLSANHTNSTANAWDSTAADQNQSVAAGDDIEINLVSTSGAVTKVNIQVDLTRP